MTEESQAIAAIRATKARDHLIAKEIKALFDRGEMCDLVLNVGQGRSFPAHRAVLAAQSTSFREYLKQPQQPLPKGGSVAIAQDDPMRGALSLVPSSTPDAGSVPAQSSDTSSVLLQQKRPLRLELQVNCASSPEAVQLMLDYLYASGTGAAWKYEPGTAAVNADVLNLSKCFRLQSLHELAARYLVHGLSTDNAVGRLVLCEEHGLQKLRDQIVKEITTNNAALMAVVSNGETIKHPEIMRELLMAKTRGAIVVPEPQSDPATEEPVATEAKAVETKPVAKAEKLLPQQSPAKEQLLPPEKVKAAPPAKRGRRA